MVFFPSYDIDSKWSADKFTAAEVGFRVRAMLEKMEPLLRRGERWFIDDYAGERYVDLEEVAPDITAIVQSNQILDDWGAPTPGFALGAHSAGSLEEPPSGSTMRIMLSAGTDWYNYIEFRVGEIRYPIDFSLMTYPTYRSALEAIVTTWPCPWALARTFQSAKPPVDEPATADERKSSIFSVAWIGYLSPALARGLAPPPEVVSEPTPGGGVIMSAVQTVIDQFDPDHMRRARVLERIMRERVGLEPNSRQANVLPPRIGPY